MCMEAMEIKVYLTCLGYIPIGPYRTRKHLSCIELVIQ